MIPPFSGNARFPDHSLGREFGQIEAIALQLSHAPRWKAEVRTSVCSLSEDVLWEFLGSKTYAEYTHFA